MVLGAAGAIVPFFFLHWNENVTGFMSFGLAACGFFLGSLVGRPTPPTEKFLLAGKPQKAVMS